MRVKYSKLLTFLIITVNIFLVYVTWKLFVRPMSLTADPFRIVVAPPPPPTTEKSPQKPRDRIQSANKHIKKTVTIVFRDFYHFDSDLKGSIDSVLALIPAIQILIVYDEEPYPPMEYFANYTATKNVRLVNLAFDVRRTGRSVLPMNLIKTRYTLLLPDSVRLGGRSIIQKMLKEIGSGTDVMSVAGVEAKLNGAAAAVPDSTHAKEKRAKQLLAIPFASNIRGYANCCRINLDLANWTLEYSVKNGTDNCDMFLQKHAILIETSILKEMPDALAAPYPEMLYIQAKVGNIKKLQLSANLQDGKRLFTAYHNKQRKKEIRRQQFRDMYRRLQIKKVIRKVTVKPKMDKQKKHRTANANGGGGGGGAVAGGVIEAPSELKPADVHISNATMVTTVSFYGCEKNTRSCVGPVFNSRPFYVYLEKHTPPCCTEKLKTVFHHVLDEFENVGIRYWLDNQALKGAIDTSGLSADAFEIDIGFNAFDLERSAFLKKCQTRPLIDAAGFYWIKATDGHYFRVQYSKINQIGVNLLPYDIEGDRVIPSGFYGWKAKEFSSEYLHPMSTVVFLAKNVMCPNNVKEFLDLKGIK